MPTPETITSVRSEVLRALLGHSGTWQEWLGMLMGVSPAYSYICANRVRGIACMNGAYELLEHYLPDWRLEIQIAPSLQELSRARLHPPQGDTSLDWRSHEDPALATLLTLLDALLLQPAA